MHPEYTLPRLHKMFHRTSEGVELNCPVCHYEYASLEDVQECPSHDDYGASHVYDIGVRGPVTVLNFEGECGHRWALVLGFHKGKTEVLLVVKPDA